MDRKRILNRLMSDASVLKRKLAPPLAKALADCAVESLLRKTMPRDADNLFSLDLFVDEVAFDEADKDNLIKGLEDTDLVYRLTNDRKGGGLCVLSPELLAGLLEIQLYGYVSSSALVERKPTRTDGIVAATLVDAWLTNAQEVAESEGMEPMPFHGFARRDGVLDKRNAALLVEPGVYDQMTVKMTLGDKAKTGTLTLAWPKGTQKDAPGSALGKQMERRLANLEAPLNVVLTRLSLPIERVRSLAVDDVIDVPTESLVSVKLEGIDGTPVGIGRLGQMNGMRAVRLNVEKAPIQTALAPPEETPQGMPPDMKELSSHPEMSEVPDLPDLPDIDLSDAGELPDLPDLPDPGTLSDLPDLPDIGTLPDLPGDLPDLPGGELPDLPDLPDMP